MSIEEVEFWFDISGISHDYVIVSPHNSRLKTQTDFSKNFDNYYQHDNRVIKSRYRISLYGGFIRYKAYIFPFSLLKDIVTDNHFDFVNKDREYFSNSLFSIHFRYNKIISALKHEKDLLVGTFSTKNLDSKKKYSIQQHIRNLNEFINKYIQTASNKDQTNG